MTDLADNPKLGPLIPAPVIAGYRIESRIGSGGMATVYLARQLSLDRAVAIKVMATGAGDVPAQAARFEHEARIIARLEHPGIVGIHEVGRLEDGQLYYVMPHLPNGDLASRDLRTDELAVVAVLRVLLQALGHAHAHGIVHRDVKPENVLFDAAGSPRLADFGIAIGRRKSAPRITREGMALGSSGFMAPEQARGEDIDGRADLYSVGVLAHLMLSGRLPFEAEDELSLALMHAQDPPPRLPANRRHWQRLLDRAMAKWPEQRYADAAAMLRELDEVERVIQQSHRRLPSRILHAVLAPRAALGLLVLLLLAAFWLWQRPPDAPGDATAGRPVAMPATDELATLMATGNAQLSAGALVVPAGANAAETYLDVLRQQPGRADAMNGLQRVFAGLAQQAGEAAGVDDFEVLRERLQQADLLAEGLGALGDEGRNSVRGAAQRALDAQVAQALAAADRARVQRLLAIYAEHGLDASAARALAARLPAEVPANAAATPGVGLSQAVSVADYRRFSSATGRAPTRCRARLSPLQLLDKRDWRDPGFPQTDASPVVCISHADAEAYAAWLSARSGKPWRLPTLAERRSSDERGALAEWTSDCADRGGCTRRLVWASDGGGQPREAARGFDEIGFRLIGRR